MNALRSLLASVCLLFASLLPAVALPAQNPLLGLGGSESHLTIEAKVDPATAQANGQVTLVVTVTVEPGWHVYGSKEETGTPTSLAIPEGQVVEAVGPARVPEGVRHDTAGMASYTLEDSFEIRQTLRVKKGTALGEQKFEFQLIYLPCTNEFCDPQAKETGTATVTVLEGEAADVAAPPLAGPDDEDTSLLLFLLAAIGAGLFALAMPCTYPMIPITISFFTKQAQARGGRVLPLALTYGFGIVLMFALIGAAVGLIGEAAGSWIQGFASNPWLNLVIGIVFLVFGLSLFGLISLQPPQALMNLAGAASRHGGFGGVFLMGATLVITSFTCTAPFVGGLLGAGVGKGFGPTVLGMAVFGLTMAVPFVALSLVPGRLQAMPRSGEWMNVLKVTFGFIELAAALKFFSTADMVWQWQALPRDLFLWLWAGIFGVAGAYLLGMIKLKGEDGSIGPGRLTSGLGAILLAIYCVFGALGNPMDWVMTAIVPDYTLTATGEGGQKLAPKHVIVKDNHARALEVAIAEDKLLLINFTGFA